MNFRKNQALWTSVILHAVVLFALFLATIIETFRPKEKPHVFEIVSSPSASTSTSTPAAEPSPPIETPSTEPLLPPVPEVNLPKPQPPAPPKPAPKPVAKPTPKPAPTAEPAPRPKEKTISYEEFLKNNKVPDPKPRQPQPKKTFEAPTIDTSRLQSNLQILLQNQTQVDASMSAAMQDALARYGAQLNARLNRAWRKPANLAGIRLATTVVFHVAPSGRISNVRLRPSSGNATFDASVKAAFSSVSGIGATPTGDSHTFTMTFRMAD